MLHVLWRLGLSSGRFHVVTLWICLFVRMVATEGTCGTDFDDVASSALLAPIVLEGRARRVLYETGEQLPGNVARPSSGVRVVFDRLRLYKGQLVESSVEVRAIEVGHFGNKVDREACVAALPVIGRSYVLFLRHNESQTEGASANISGTENDDRRLRGRAYRLSAFPVRKYRQNIATVVQFTNCSRCGRAPTVRLMPDNDDLRKQEGQRLELRCRSRRVRPRPRLVWSRNGVVLAGGVNRVRITYSRRGSKLQVRRLREDDAGLYQCQAMNVVGQSDRRSVDVVVVPNVEPTRVHSVICSEHSYCLNGGTCFIMLSLRRRYCICQEGFIGARCEVREVTLEGPQPVQTGGVDRLNALEAILIISGVVAAALTAVAIAIIIFSSARRSAVKREETKRHKQQVETVVNERTGRAGVWSQTPLRRDTTTSNGRVSQSNRLSERRRSRLQAASTTPRSEDLNAVGDLQLSIDDVGRPQRSDSLRQALLLNVNGDHSTCVEKETTC